MSKCCVGLPDALYPFKKEDTTCKINPAAVKIFNSYTLNKQQDMKKGNTLDFNSLKLAKAYGKDAVRRNFHILCFLNPLIIFSVLC